MQLKLFTVWKNKLHSCINHASQSGCYKTVNTLLIEECLTVYEAVCSFM